MYDNKPDFKVWDKYNQRMNVVNHINFSDETVSVTNSDGEEHELGFEHAEFIRYIGLRDANGAKVYEGDIIKGRAVFHEGGFDYLGYVEFSPCSHNFGYYLTDSSGGSWEIKKLRARISLDNITGSKIGNIYEDKELMY